MKILIFNWQDIKNPNGGGAEVHLHEIFRRIAAMGNEVTLFCCKHADLADEEIVGSIRIIRRGSRNTFNFLVPVMYRRLFRHENYDIVIDDINKIPFYTPLYVKEPLLAISHHFFGRSIFRESGLISGLYVYFSEWLVDFIYKKTPFAVVSESTLNEFASRGFDTSHFAIIKNALTQIDFPMAIGEKNPYPTVCYFGRLKKYKSVDHLLLAFSKVAEQIPEARLHIIGRGSFQPYLETLATKLGISEKTTFFGYVSDEEKIRLLSGSHCLANTSMKEGWGITNIESNACGTPVISSDVPGLRDSVKSGVSGLLYPYGDIEELAKVIISVLHDSMLCQKLCDGAVEWAKSFSWDDSARQMIEKCEDVVRNFKSRSS